MIEALLRVGDTDDQDKNLQTGGITLLNYAMDAPELNQDVIDNLGDGDTLAIPSFTNVTETLTLLIRGTDDQIASHLKGIERLLDLARQGSRGILDDRLYLVVKFDSDTEYWRTQILAARLPPLRVSQQYWRGSLEIDLIITRRYYFETAVSKLLELTSTATTTETTAGVIIHNNDDAVAGQRNWFQIAADQIGGSLPTPLSIFIRNTSAGVRATASITMGNYVWNDPTTIDPIFTHANSSSTDTDWEGTAENDIYAWHLTSENQTAAFKGGFARIVAVFSDRPDDLTLLRPKIQYRQPSPQVDIAQGEWVLNGTSFVKDLGGLPLPPGNTWVNMGNLLYLVLSGKAVAAEGDSVAVDWVQLMPSGPGRFRVLRAVTPTWSLAVNDYAVDDGAEGGAYTIEGGNNYPAWIQFFEPIHGWPNKINRIAVIIEGSSFTGMETGEEWTVTARCRPRRLSI